MKALINKIRRILKDRRTRRMITRIVSFSAALVVFVTTYALVLPAITMEAEAQCGIEAHQHDDSCYEDVLVCGQEESEGHTHDESCYSISQELICEIPEHQHDETCYDEDGNLQCQIQEHEHTDNCYIENRELTCTLEESEGHHHTDACYEKNLICGKEVHTHSPACYEKEAADAVEAFAGYTAGTAYEVDDGSDSGDNSGADGLHAAGYNDGSEGSGDTDGSEGAVGADASAGTDNTDLSAWEPPLLEESAAAATTNVLLPEDLQSEDLSDGYVPQLDSLYFDAVLNNHTAFYYFHPEEGEEVPANSVDITSWKPVDKNTELAPTDLVKAYLSYTIPAGSLNETNQIARYRLPANIHLTDDQIIAINNNENGIAAGYVDPSTNTVLDEDADNYHKYLGAEAVEGTRRPDQDPRSASGNGNNGGNGNGDADNGLGNGAQEFISATVKAENVFDEEGLYGEKGAYLGQDLIFVFSPYTIEKNQTTYDTAGNPTAKGEKVTGWFAVDLNMEQIDWSEPVETILPMDDENQTAAAQNHYEDQNQNLEQAQELEQGQAQDQGQETVLEQDQTTADDNIHPRESAAQTTHTALQRIERTANVVFVAEGKDENNHKIHEICSELKLVQMNEIEIEDEDPPAEDSEEQAESPESDDVEDTSDSAEPAEDGAHIDAEAVSEENKEEQAEKAVPEYKDGTLEAKGNGYKITMDYKADAQIPENAYLHVTEITRESDAKAYEACLEEARKSVLSDRTRVDDKASRFFDIEIIVDELVSKEGNADEKVSEITGEDSADNGADAKTEGTFNTVSNHAAESDETQMTTRKIEPAAPVSVNIQLFDTEISQKPDEFNADQYKVVHIAEDKTEEIQDVKAQTIEPEKKDAESGPAKKESDPETTSDAPATEVQFEAESFSIYGVVYTVDFHWEVDGKTYDFSIPGGGFVSLEQLVEVLGIADSSTTGAPEDDTEPGLTLSEVTVSDNTKRFIEDVEKVSISAPELISVSKVEETTTVGEIKDRLQLECEYSAGLTEHDIEMINSTEVEEGDWALISLKSFETKETLTVTMKSGEEFTILVTDPQEDPNGLDGKSFVLVGQRDNKSHVLTDNISPNNYNNQSDRGKPLLGVYTDYIELNGIQYSSNGAALWTMEYAGNNKYYLKNANGKYLKISGTQKENNMNPFSFVDNPNDTDTFATLNNAGNVKAGITIGNADGLKLWNYGDGYFLVDKGNDYNNYSRFYLCVAEDETFERPPVLSTADTRSQGVKLWFFDYDLDGSLDNDANMVGQIKETDNKNSINGCNPGSDLKFLGWGAANQETNRSGLNDFTGLDEGNSSNNGYPNGNMIRALQGIVENTLDESGYPKITGGTSLQYLFDPEANTPDRLVYGGTSKDAGNVNYLFQNVNGYYNFNSNKSYAELNGNDFTVYNTILNQTQKDGSLHADPRAVGFFPFDSYESVLSRKSARSNILYLNPDKDNNNQKPSFLNHHFGLAMETQFVIPENGVNEDGSPIIFDFSGDDDMWVYIDDQLVLDIGGLHQPVSGRIDFSSGYATITGDSRTPHQTDRDNTGNNAVVAYKNATDTRGGNYNFLEDLSSYMAQGDGKVHTMKIFYMERGGCDSNCRITFNMPLVQGKGDVRVAKKSSTEEIYLPGAEFGIWENPSCTGNAFRTGTTDENGLLVFDKLPVKEEGQVYYMKETKAPANYITGEEIYKLVAVKQGNGYVFEVRDLEDHDVETIPQEPYNDAAKVLNTKIDAKMDVSVHKVWMQDGVVMQTAPKDTNILLKLKRYKPKYTVQTREPKDATITFRRKYDVYRGGQFYPLESSEDITGFKTGQKIIVKWTRHNAAGLRLYINNTLLHDSYNSGNGDWNHYTENSVTYIIPEDGVVDIFSDEYHGTLRDVYDGKVISVEVDSSYTPPVTDPIYLLEGMEEDLEFEYPTITLSNDKGWDKTVNVDSADEHGNLYEYYFEEMPGSTVPAGTVVTYEMEGEEKKRIDFADEDKELTVTNVLPDTTSIPVKKNWSQTNNLPENAEIQITLGRLKLVNDQTDTKKYGQLNIEHLFTGARTTMPEGFEATYTVTGGPQTVDNPTSSQRVEAGTYTVTETITNKGNYSPYTVSESNRTVTVNVPENGTGTATFTSTYTKEQVHIIVNRYYYNDLKETVSADVDAGSQVRVNIHRPDNDGLALQYKINNGNEANLDFSQTGGYISTGINVTYTFDVEPVNGTCTINIYQRNYADGLVSINSVEQVPNQPAAFSAAGRMMRSIKRKASSLRNEALNLIELNLSQGSYTMPASTVPGKVYEEDTWAYTAVLKNGVWEKTITQADMPEGQYLTAKDSDGYDYLYFIKSVRELNMPAGTTGSIDKDGDQIITSTGDTTLSVTNDVPENGSLKITKEVTLHGDPVTNYTEKTPADGEYTFEVTKKGDTTGTKHVVKLTITNGQPASDTLEDLDPGTYVVTEINPQNGTSLTAINGQSVEEGTWSKEVEVPAGKHGENVVPVIFTNNYESGEVSFTKTDADGSGLPGATFALYKTYEDGELGDPLTIDGSEVTAVSASDGDRGKVTFTDIPVGTYYMKETDAPQGYVLSPHIYLVRIKDGKDASSVSRIYAADGTVVTQIANTPTPDNPDAPPAQVENHKRIDALRDGAENLDSPHTGEELTDLYRLYLDYKINSMQVPEGIDLLFVLDHSGSMNSQPWQSGGDPRRAPTIQALLNGENGLIADFLAKNDKNRWAAVGFKGESGFRYLAGFIQDNAGINDSELLSGDNWKNTRSDVYLRNEGASKLTDYTAGFWRAEQFLKDNDGRKKVIVFISDGLPTLYIPCEGTLENAGTATGSDYYPAESGGCVRETLEQFDNFLSDLQSYGYTFGTNIDLYTIGFGYSIIGGGGQAILDDMVDKAYEGTGVSTTGHSLGFDDGDINSTAAAMKEALSGAIGLDESFDHIVIRDQLSKYVDIYGLAEDATSKDILTAAGAKVTMTNPENLTEEIVLYDAADTSTTNGFTAAGAEVLKSVVYNTADKTVTVTFEDGYEALPGITYTLSFDVKASDAAYTEYANAEKGKEYGITVGDLDTDYLGTDPDNATSSRKPGYYSNSSATVSYKHTKGDTEKNESKDYPKPVIQVFEAPIELLKTDQVGNPVAGAKFNLYNDQYDTSKEWNDPVNVKCKVNDEDLISTIQKVILEDEREVEKAVIKDLKLKHGVWYLVETGTPDGYNSLEGPVRIEVKVSSTDVVTVKASINGVERGMPDLQSVEAGANDWILKIRNETGVELPNTGGPGARPFYLLGVLLASFAGAGLLLRKHRSPG